MSNRPLSDSWLSHHALSCGVDSRRARVGLGLLAILLCGTFSAAAAQPAPAQPAPAQPASSQPVPAQSNPAQPPGEPQATGGSAATSAASVVDALDEYIARAQTAWEVPGLAVAIVKDGQVVLAKGYGVRELGSEEAVDADTVFAIASNTKAFTAAALAMLVEEGKLDWQDRVQDHLPYFQLYDPYVSAEMRVEDLLCHRSGLGTFSGDLLWYGTEYTPEEILRRTRYLPPAGSFRSHYGYSNLMYLAAGEMVARVSGKTWSQFVQERILQPLDMERTVTSVSDLSSLENVATPHKVTPEGVRPLAWYPWDAMAAAGGINSSVQDMAAWLQVQLDRGELPSGGRLFSRDSSEKMWAPHTVIPLNSFTRQQYPSTHFRAYGLGWSLADYKGHKVISHGGGYDGMFSRVALVPEAGLGVVVLTNSMTGIATALSNRVIDAYLGGEQPDWSASGLTRDRADRASFYARIQKAISPRADGTQPSHPLQAYAGTYGGKMYGDAKVSVKDDHLELLLLPNPQLIADLQHLHYDTFVIRWRNEFAWFAEGTATFLTDAQGKVVEMKLDVPNEDFWFDELELKRK